MFLLRPESGYSGGLNSSLVVSQLPLNPVGDLIAVFAGTWISTTGAPPNAGGCGSWFARRIGAFFSAPEIPFPGNGAGQDPEALLASGTVTLPLCWRKNASAF